MSPTIRKSKKTEATDTKSTSNNAISTVISKSLPLNPRLSEKAYGLSELRNTYIFDVPYEYNRHSIARAVEAQYEVSVVGVRVAGVPGKTGRTIRRGRVVGQSKRSDIRKAYVTLKEGDKLPLFATEQDGRADKEAK